MTQTYEDRIKRVVDYIFDNPDGDLSLDALSDVAAMSRFHWHRVYRAVTGETCAQAVRRIRAHRAACWLVQSDWPVAEVAKRAGYDNTHSFARVFRAQFGMTPRAFRKQGQLRPMTICPKSGETRMYDVDFREIEGFRLMSVPHVGAYPEIGRAFGALSAIFSAQGLWPHARGMIAVFYDDPSSVPEAELKSDAGVIVGQDLAVPKGAHELILPAGRHAILTHKGDYSGLQAAYDYLYCNWLPKSGVEPANRACFEVYLNDPANTAPADLVTEIHLPLA